MKIQNDIINQNDSYQSQLDIKALVFQYLSKWYWFLLSTIILLFLAHMYLRYTVPQYSASATILVKDDKKGGMVSELAGLSEVDMLGKVKSSVDNEMEIIKSRTLIMSSIRDLELNVRYYSQGRVKAVELYKSSPVRIVFDSPEISGMSVKVEILKDGFYKLLDVEENLIGQYKFGQLVKYKENTFTIINSETKSQDLFISIIVSPPLQTAQGYKSRLNVKLIGDKTSVVELSIVDPIKQRAEDFLNAMIKNYNLDAIKDKSAISRNTSNFIDERLSLIANELGDVERSGEAYKKDNQVTDIVSEAANFLENATDIQKNFLETETQLRVVESLRDFVRKSGENQLIPDNILTTMTADANASPSLISEYNTLLLQRERLAPSAGPENREMKILDSQISSLKQNVIANLERLKNTLEIKKRDLLVQRNRVSGKISEVPTQEREYKGILRQQNIKESLYLYLLQKREETAIALASTAPNAKIIDSALTSNSPISPRTSIVYLGALLLGLFIPFGVIYLEDLLDTKIHTQADLAGLSVPYLGDIPRSFESDKIITMFGRTSTAEALRILRTNLEFLLNQVPENIAKTIFVTSTIPREGKTFVTINLGATIALSGKRVLLVAMDIRSPKFDEYMDIPQKGFTNYLSTPNANIHDYIVQHETLKDLYILPAGVVPPNPAELLMDPRVEAMILQLQKEFDYLIVDTAPVSLVTDTQIIAKFAHCFVYVARANHLDKQLLSIPERLYRENKLPNMAMLLNDTDLKKGYGYGYGDVYGKDVKKPWYKRFPGKKLNS